MQFIYFLLAEGAYGFLRAIFDIYQALTHRSRRYRWYPPDDQEDALTRRKGDALRDFSQDRSNGSQAPEFKRERARNLFGVRIPWL